MEQPKASPTGFCQHHLTICILIRAVTFSVALAVVSTQNIKTKLSKPGSGIVLAQAPPHRSPRFEFARFEVSVAGNETTGSTGHMMSLKNRGPFPPTRLIFALALETGGPFPLTWLDFVLVSVEQIQPKRILRHAHLPKGGPSGQGVRWVFGRTVAPRIDWTRGRRSLFFVFAAPRPGSFSTSRVRASPPFWGLDPRKALGLLLFLAGRPRK